MLSAPHINLRLKTKRVLFLSNFKFERAVLLQNFKSTLVIILRTKMELAISGN